MSQKYDVVGLGNALMDALYLLPDDKLLSDLSLNKGEMHMVDDEKWTTVYSVLDENKVSLQTGGSCANTIATLGLMGASVSYCSQVGDDAFGETYQAQFTDACGGHDLHLAKGTATGKCLSLISKDAERTMLTDLGTAVNLASVSHFQDAIANSKILYLTGYLMFGQMRERMLEAIAIAKEHNVQIALDVADPSVISILRDDMYEVIRDHVDIVFLNEKEAQALCGGTPESAIEELIKLCSVVVVKLGSKGSMARVGHEEARTDIFSVVAVDTTGAGDSYAAGFLYGYVRDWPLQKSVRLASRVAAQAVSQLGAVVRDRELLTDIVAEISV
jgi:sugar/nucleoside kinase (ribokinase family)